VLVSILGDDFMLLTDPMPTQAPTRHQNVDSTSLTIATLTPFVGNEQLTGLPSCNCLLCRNVFCRLTVIQCDALQALLRQPTGSKNPFASLDHCPGWIQQGKHNWDRFWASPPSLVQKSRMSKGRLGLPVLYQLEKNERGDSTGENGS
jgi:hypothetical protein